MNNTNTIYGSFMSPPAPKGIDNRSLQSFPGFSAPNSLGQSAFGSAMLPSYPQEELPPEYYGRDEETSYLVNLLRTNPARLGL